jgi:hypothetical protein
MQDQRIPGAPSDAPQLGSHEHDVQRRVLLELLTTPLPEGDEVASLTTIPSREDPIGRRSRVCAYPA